MALEKKLALELVATIAERFGPASKISQEVPRWLEIWTAVECPERPKSLPAAKWWRQVRRLTRSQAELAPQGNGDIVRTNIDRFAEHFGLSTLETRILGFMTYYRLVEAFRHSADASDQELAKLPAYNAFLRYGLTLYRTAGAEACRILGLALLQGHPEPTKAQAALHRFWASLLPESGSGQHVSWH